MQVTCHISLESSRQGLKLCVKPHFNQKFAQEVMGLQNLRSSILRILRLPNLGILGQNDIWVQALWPGIKNNIKGRWWLPPSLDRGEFCEYLFAHGLYVHKKCFNYALINLLFSLCRSMWIIDLLVICPNLILELQHAPLLSKCCKPRNIPQFLILPLFSPLDSKLNPSRSLGVR